MLFFKTAPKGSAPPRAYPPSLTGDVVAGLGKYGQWTRAAALPLLPLALSSHRKGQPRPRTLIGALLIARAADLAGQRDDQF
jgi:hypothetical protein